MDTELAIRLTDIVKSIGDAKYEIMGEVSNVKREVAIIKTNLNNHLEQVEGKETTKRRAFDKKTVIISLVIGGVAVLAVFT